MTQWTHRAGHDSRLILKACSTLGAMQRLMTLENDGKLLFEIRCYAYFQLYTVMCSVKFKKIEKISRFVLALLSNFKSHPPRL